MIRAASFISALTLWAACNPAPAIRVGSPPQDAASPGDGDAASSRITVAWDRPFGPDGERPAHLAAGVTGRLWAVSSRAIYSLDSLGGRVISRLALPASATGALPAVTAAMASGATLGLVLRWPGLASASNPWRVVQVSSTLSHGQGSAVSPGCLDALGSRGLVLFVQPAGAQHEVRVQEAGKSTSAAVLSGFPAAGALGGWAALAGEGAHLCASLPGGVTALWTGQVKPSVGTFTRTTVHAGPRPSLGRCRLAASGRSVLTAYMVQAKPYGQLDLGPGAPDMGVKGVAYPEPTARVLAPGASSTPSLPLRLSHKGGTLALQDLLWDGARYLALTDAAGLRGGRLMLTALDEAGRLLHRDLEVPLSYEPGRLLGARLLAHADGSYTLLYATRRPWDSGVLHLARLTVSW